MPSEPHVATHTPTLDDLEAAGLVRREPQLHLTDKGRRWLDLLGYTRALEDAAGDDDVAADLILSTSGLYR